MIAHGRIIGLGHESQKVYGGGGTYFHILENKCQEIKRRDGKYPAGVFVITDARGNIVEPEFPELWYWFLDKPHRSKTCIPDKSHTFNLEDYE